MNSFLQPQIEYLLLLQNFRDYSGHIFDSFFSHITMFGEYAVTILFTAFVYWILNKKDGIFISMNICFSMLVNTFLKITACIYRPWILDSRIHPVDSAIKLATGYSFPSGHTALATATWGSVAAKYWANKKLRYSMIILILLVGFSRNYLGVHTPQDVIVSLVLGIGIIFGTKKLTNRIENGKNNDLIIFGIIIIINTLLLLYAEFKTYPIDIVNGSILVDPDKMKLGVYPKVGFITGIFAGWLADRRYIKFENPSGSILSKIIIYGIGALILALIFTTTKEFFVNMLNLQYGLLLQSLIIGFFISGIYPAVIKSLAKLK